MQPLPQGGRDEGLSARLVRSFLWMAGLGTTVRGLSLVRLFLLGRLLSPADFGVVGTGVIAIGLFQAIMEGGVELALLRKERISPEFLDSAWAVGIVRGVLTSVAVFLVAPLLGSLAGSEDVVRIVRVMAVIPVLSSFANVAIIDYRRDLELAPYFLLQTCGVAADLFAALALALIRPNAWALVGGWLALTGTHVGMSYVLHPYRPRFRLSRTHTAELLAQAPWMSGSSMLGWLQSNGLPALVVSRLGVESLGLFHVAWRVGWSLLTEVAQMLSNVSLAAYAGVRHDLQRLRAIFQTALALLLLIIIPGAAGLAAFSEDLVRILLGPRWMPTAALVGPLAAAAAVSAVGLALWPVLLSAGQARLRTAGAFVEALLLLLMASVLMTEVGLTGLPWLTLIASSVGTLVGVIHARRLLGPGLMDLRRCVTAPVLASAPGLIFMMLADFELRGIVELAAVLSGAVLLYLSGLVLLWRLGWLGGAGTFLDSGLFRTR